MSGKIIITVKKGGASGKTFTYEGKEALILGRRDDCAIVLPETTVSRYHCLIDIAPPSVMVRDFGSLNGTYLNGEKIGQRKEGVSAEEAWEDGESRGSVFEMKPGDRLGLGKECEIQLEVKLGAEEKTRPSHRDCDVCGESLSVVDGPGICEPCSRNPMKLFPYVVQQDAGYRYLKELGRGGMGMVWLVEEEATGEKMALKMMLPQVLVYEKAWQAFLRELNVSGQLEHRNIVRQHKCGRLERLGGVFIALMEYCDGGSVLELMNRSGGKLSLDLATNIILQTLDSLIYAHSAPVSVRLMDGSVVSTKGIVHRDIKPDNIFLSGSGENLTVKIGDFGLAKSFEAAGLTGHTHTNDAASGTLQFMPRQQIISYKYSKPPVDVWAGAASYYFMLTGSTPKDFSGGGDRYRIALTEDAIPIRKRNPSIPEKLADVIDKALIEKPDIGVQSAAELKKMIVSALP